MKNVLASFSLALFTLAMSFTTHAQSEIQSDSFDVHITSSTTRMELAQLQKDFSEVGIGFRYDLIDWTDETLQSIRLAIILPDGSMRRHMSESLDADADIWLRLEGSGTERIFCAGDNCED